MRLIVIVVNLAPLPRTIYHGAQTYISDMYNLYSATIVPEI